MKHAKHNKHLRVKAVAIAVAALAVGIGLLILSRVVIASGEKAALEAARAAEAAKTQPAADPTDATGEPARDAAEPAAPPDASGTATAPAGSATTPAGRVPPADPKAVTAQRMGGLLLLFSLMSFALVIICIGWIIYDVRRSRPAWMRQTKYPVHERRK